MEKPYRYIEHTADLGIEVWGSTLTDLFIHVGRAIFETQIIGEIKARRHITIAIQSEAVEDLFIDWCRELLYHFSVEGFIPKEYTLIFENNSLTAKLSGDVFDPKRHKTKLEIKNPTYHNLSIKKTDTGYQATIIFDV
jgi:SHS2 domain-containing protein